MDMFSLITPTVNCRVNFNSTQPDPFYRSNDTYMYRPNPFLGCPVSTIMARPDFLHYPANDKLYLTFLCASNIEVLLRKTKMLSLLSCLHPNKFPSFILVRKMKTRESTSSQWRINLYRMNYNFFLCLILSDIFLYLLITIYVY